MGVGKQASDYALSRLIDLGYLDDEDWLERFVDIRQESLSKRALRQKLYQKGVPSEKVDAALEDYCELTAAEKLIQKKGSLDRNKLIRTLQSKGFGWDVIAKLVPQLDL